MSHVTVTQVAVSVPFDSDSNGFIADDTQAAVEEARSKSGTVANTSFAGNPKKATVVFSPAFPTGTTYGVAIIGTDGRIWTAESLTVSGFVINSNANQSLTSPVRWIATRVWG